MSDVLTVAGNVPPVDLVMNGTKEEIYESVKQYQDGVNEIAQRIKQR